MGKTTSNDLGTTIGSRFQAMRKHLSERLGEDLSMEDIANKTGLKKNQVFYMERDMSGTSDSLVRLLTFYRSQGYNLDWILNTTDNKRLPMMITSGKDLLSIVQQLGNVAKFIQDNHQDLTTKLLDLGYQPMESVLVSTEEPSIAMPTIL